MKNLQHVQQAVEASLREFAQVAETPLSSEERALGQTLRTLSERLKYLLASPELSTSSPSFQETSSASWMAAWSQRHVQVSPCYFVTSSNGTILTACENACSVLGIDQHGLGIASLRDFIPSDEWKLIHQMLQKDESVLSSNTWSATLRTTSGQNQSMRATVTPLFDCKHHVSAWAWNLEILDELQREAPPVSFMQDYSAQLVEGKSLEFCLSQICQGIVSIFGISLAWIASCQEGPESLSLLAHAEAKKIDWVNFGPMWWKDFSESQPLTHFPPGVDVIHGTHNDLPLGKVAWVPPVLGLREWVIIPLRHGETVCGVLVVASDQPAVFKQSLCAWLQGIRAQILALVDCGNRLADMRLRSAAMDSVSYAVCVVDLNGCIKWVNEAYTKLVDQPVHALLGTLFRTFPKEQLQSLVHSPSSGGLPTGCLKSEVHEKRPTGEEIDLEQVVTPVVNQQGEITHYVAILQDISGRKTAEAEIKHLAFHDSLTDLPNRMMFEDRLQQALAQTRRQGGLLAVLFLDLDNFKPINDQYGHRMGDRLLRIVAKRLVTCVRSTDTVARLSGDEFTIILQGLDRVRDIRQVAQKILDCLTPPIRLNNHRIFVKTSIGIAVYPNDTTQPAKLLEVADHAMYQAKEQGGQKWVFATPEWNLE